MGYRIRNWFKYQARTDRVSSPWVKLHKDLINSADFYSIPEKRRWEWPVLMLMSKNHDGLIHGTDQEIGFVLYKVLDRAFDPAPFLDRLLEREEQEQEQEIDKEQEEEEETGTSGDRSVTSGNQVVTSGIPVVTKPVVIDDSKVLGVFPTKEGDWEFRESSLEVLVKAYGDQANRDWIRQELKAAKAWLVVSPDRQKTNRGMMKYLNGWRKRAIDSGGPGEAAKRERMRAAKRADLDQERRHSVRISCTCSGGLVGEGWDKKPCDCPLGAVFREAYERDKARGGELSTPTQAEVDGINAEGAV